jgi:hypothetical protein
MYVYMYAMDHCKIHLPLARFVVIAAFRHVGRVETPSGGTSGCQPWTVDGFACCVGRYSALDNNELQACHVFTRSRCCIARNCCTPQLVPDKDPPTVPRAIDDSSTQSARCFETVPHPHHLGKPAYILQKILLYTPSASLGKQARVFAA